MNWKESILIFSTIVVAICIGVKLGKDSRKGSIDSADLVFILASLAYLAETVPKAREKCKRLSARLSEPFGMEVAATIAFNEVLHDLDEEAKQKMAEEERQC